MKVFISADIEGVNGITNWDETFDNNYRYPQFQKQMIEEVKMACVAAKDAGATEIVIKDAHDSALNLIHSQLPEYTKLIRGWEGSVCSMMAGLDESFDAVIFIGYHSPSRSSGNSLSHTMNTRIHHIKINNHIASEFLINSLYAFSINVPIAFVSGDLVLTQEVKGLNPNIEVVATKIGMHGATLSNHPSITNNAIYDGVYKSLTKGSLKESMVDLPKKFDIEIQYQNHIDAYNKSFFPGCKLINSDTIAFSSSNYYDCLVAFKFIL